MPAREPTPLDRYPRQDVVPIEVVAARLTISEEGVYRLLNDRRLSGRRQGSLWGVCALSLQWFIEEITSPKRDPVPIPVEPREVVMRRAMDSIMSASARRDRNAHDWWKPTAQRRWKLINEANCELLAKAIAVCRRRLESVDEVADATRLDADRLELAALRGDVPSVIEVGLVFVDEREIRDCIDMRMASAALGKRALKFAPGRLPRCLQKTTRTVAAGSPPAHSCSILTQGCSV